MTSHFKSELVLAIVSATSLVTCSSGSHPRDAAMDLPLASDAAISRDAAGAVDGGHATDGATDGYTPKGFRDASVAMGGSCQVNSDCTNSPAAAALANVRCAGGEIYCWNAECYSDCMDTCTVVRTDVNPCPTPRICEPRFGGQQSFCAMTVAKCQSAADCPAYLPHVDAGQAVWSCVGGICTFPGYEFPTQ